MKNILIKMVGLKNIYSSPPACIINKWSLRIVGYRKQIKQCAGHPPPPKKKYPPHKLFYCYNLNA